MVSFFTLLVLHLLFLHNPPFPDSIAGREAVPASANQERDHYRASKGEYREEGSTRLFSLQQPRKYNRSTPFLSSEIIGTESYTPFAHKSIDFDVFGHDN